MLEEAGRASVVLVTEPFAAVARASASARGLPDLPIVVLPADLEDLSPDKVADVMRDRWPELRRGWIRGAGTAGG